MLADLVIDLRDGGDWSLDLCFAGLVMNLGPEWVVDVPKKAKHREWDPERSDWGMERRTLGYTPQNHLVLPRSLSEVGRVWLDERMESFSKYRELGLYDAKVPAFVVAGHDRFWNHSPQFVASLYGDRLGGMLLDNWRPEYAQLPFPTKRIGWSTNFDHYWQRPAEAPPKHIDICFVGYNSHPDRARFIDHIENKWGHLRNHIYLERRPDTTEEFYSKSLLFGIMQQSRICLNLRGAADRGKTLRAYEIGHVGSYMLSQRIEDPGLMEDFVEDRDCGYFSDEDELDAKIAWALDPANESARETIASAGHLRAEGPLSVKERWADVLRWTQER